MTDTACQASDAAARHRRRRRHRRPLPPTNPAHLAPQELSTFLARAAAFTAGGPLHYCVLHSGEPPAADATRHLLRAGVRPDQHRDALGRSALHLCSLVGDAHTAELLLGDGANAALPDAGGFTPLHACFSPAAPQQALQEARSLSDSLAQQATATPAPTAATRPDRLAVAELLLAHLAGGQVDLATAAEQATPLMLAAAAGNSQAVALLLSEGAARDQTDCRGRTALMLAASAGCTEAMQLLLRPSSGGAEPPRPKAAVDVRSAEDERTALCYAVEARQPAAAELLLAAQARLDLVPKPLLEQLVGLLFTGKQARGCWRRRGVCSMTATLWQGVRAWEGSRHSFPCWHSNFPPACQCLYCRNWKQRWTTPGQPAPRQTRQLMPQPAL